MFASIKNELIMFPDLSLNIMVVIFLVLLVVILVVYFFIHGRLAFYKPENEPPAVNVPVSVIISSKNEAANLRENLPFILEQDYSSLEVIVVDDQSEDETRDLLSDLKDKYSRLKIITLEDFIKKIPGKKLPLTLAIKKAGSEHLIFTDADCRPESKNWVNAMASAYEEGTEIVLGHSPVKKGKGLVSFFSRYDAYVTARNSFSFALMGRPYMGTGRNLSYKKSLFLKNKGFAKHLHIPAGDDDLFVNENARQDNTRVRLSQESIMWTSGPATMKKWLKQKRRHQFVGKYYHSGDRNNLLILWLITSIFYCYTILAFVFNPLNVYLGGGTLVFIICWYFLHVGMGRKLKYDDLIVPSIFIDIIYNLLILPYFGLSALFQKKLNGW